MKGSLNTSSAVLLARMKSRNAHEIPTRGGSGLHQDTHDELLREMRDFIATQCKVDGQATTDEILDRFSCRLPSSSTAVFRSLLHEICDFSRYHGDGRGDADHKLIYLQPHTPCSRILFASDKTDVNGNSTAISLHLTCLTRKSIP